MLNSHQTYETAVPNANAAIVDFKRRCHIATAGIVDIIIGRLMGNAATEDFEIGHALGIAAIEDFKLFTHTKIYTSIW